MAPTVSTRLLSMIAGRTARTALSAMQAVRGTSNYYLMLLLTFDRAQTQKVLSVFSTRFKMPRTVDHYLFIYQILLLLPSLSNQAEIRLTLRTQLWNRISSN